MKRQLSQADISKTLVAKGEQNVHILWNESFFFHASGRLNIGQQNSSSLECYFFNKPAYLGIRLVA